MYDGSQIYIHFQSHTCSLIIIIIIHKPFESCNYCNVIIKHLLNWKYLTYGYIHVLMDIYTDEWDKL